MTIGAKTGEFVKLGIATMNVVEIESTYIRKSTRFATVVCGTGCTEGVGPILFAFGAIGTGV